jgi:hypothetical protein
MIEFAIVLPLLILLMIGIMEVGVASYDYLTVERASLEGVRTAAFTGRALNADCTTVQSIVDSFPTGFLDRIDRIEIYRFDPVLNQPDSAKVNVWQFLNGPDPRDCGPLNWNVSTAWPSTSRQTVAGPSARLDIIGVRIRMPRNWISSFPPFNGGYTIDEDSILRMEPEVFE